MIPYLLKAYTRLHFYLGNLYRFLTILKFQKRILVDDVSTIFGASYGKDGWHHIIKTLEEYDADEEIEYQKTSLYKFLKNFTPESICDLLENNLTTTNLSLFVFPWGTFKKDEIISTKNSNTSRFCGPSEDIFIKDEFQRIIFLYKELKKTGYRPWAYGNTFIGGTFLINNEGKKKFIVLQGNHRMAILAHLNNHMITVREVKGNLTNIYEKDINNWLMVKSNECSIVLAKDIFSLYFKENGKHLKKIIESKNYDS